MRTKRIKNIIFIIIALFALNIISFSLLMTTNQEKIDLDYLDTQIATANFNTLSSQKINQEKELEPLKEVLEVKIRHKNASISFKDLNTGATFSINQDKTYIPGSLLKVITLITIMKKVEAGELDLDQKITILKEDKDRRYGSLWKRGSGYELTLLELMQFSTKISDNTAERALRRQFSENEHIEAMLVNGIPHITTSKNSMIVLSPNSFENIFNSIYQGYYLQEESNKLILSLLANTDFKEGIPEGIPPQIKVAHKIGSWVEGNYNHDCGIIYHPQKPYILCIMTENTTPQEASILIRDISKIVYDYVDK